MAVSLARYRKISALASEPTPARRLAAAAIAGACAFILAQLLLGNVLGAGSGALLFSCSAFAVAAAIAGATLKRGLAVAYGVLAAVWLLAEAIVAMIMIVATCLG